MKARENTVAKELPQPGIHPVRKPSMPGSQQKKIIHQGGVLGLPTLALCLVLAACTNQQMAEHFNETASMEAAMPDRVIDALKLKPGQSVADLGAGGGYYSLRFARIVQPGQVFAVDINADYLAVIRSRAAEEGIKNIQTVEAGETESNLAARSVDLIFLRDSYHHLPDRIEYFRKLRKCLKENGRVAIIDHKKQGFNFVSLFGHTTDPAVIRTEMEEAGYELVESFDFLPQQSFQIFRSRP